MARKPLAGTVAQNVLEHGTGAVNVDGCRIEHDETLSGGTGTNGKHEGWDRPWMHDGSEREAFRSTSGRWPANVVLDEQAAAMLDEQTGESTPKPARYGVKGGNGGALGAFADSTADAGGYWPEDQGGGASRFLYVAKASSAERNAGLDEFEAIHRVNGNKWTDQDYRVARGERPPSAESGPRRNIHPTVKPIELMRWLIRLVTPPGGLVLDPFAGSGTTGCAAALEGFDFIGMEREPEYAAIAEARIAWWSRHPDGLEIVKALDAERERKAIRESGQMDLLS